MTIIHPHNYIQNYEAGVAALKDSPHDRQLQHKIVLALARAGALDFALSEYERFGLSAIRDNEDIMALNGRLSKDLYLRSSGQEAQKHAAAAARKYELAFQNTLGYYSGVNSATMALMADLPEERVMARIEAIEALLPVSLEMRYDIRCVATKRCWLWIWGVGCRRRYFIRGRAFGTGCRITHCPAMYDRPV